MDEERGTHRLATEDPEALSLALEQAVAATVLADRNGIVQYANASYTDLTGIPMHTVVGRQLRSLLGPAQAHATSPKSWETSTRERSWDGDSRLRTRDGETLWVSISVSPIRDEHGNTSHFVAVIRDVTEDRRTRERLLETIDGMKRLTETRSTYVLQVTQQLRVSLLAMSDALGVALLGASGGLTPAQSQFVRATDRSIGCLGSVVDDLEDLHEWDSVRTSFDITDVQLPTLLSRVFEKFQRQAIRDRVDLRLDCQQAVPEVFVDTKRIEKALTHLIRASLALTPIGGSVTLSASQDGGFVRVSVTHTGAKLDEADIERLAQPGSISQALPPGHLGPQTGVGLSIANSMIKAHGCELTVENRRESGTRFHFRLPHANAKGRELIELQSQLERAREYPQSAVLYVHYGEDAEDADTEEVISTFEQWLPRSSDSILYQPAHHRLVLILRGTHREGGAVVKERLQRQIRESAQLLGTIVGIDIAGPYLWPVDGDSVEQLTKTKPTALFRATAPRDDSGASPKATPQTEPKPS